MSEPRPDPQAILGKALEHPDPAARAAYLDRACTGDRALRRRVEALLARAETRGAPTPGAAGPDTLPPPGSTDGTGVYEPEAAHPAAGLATGAYEPGTSATEGAAPCPPDRVGNYEVLGVLGEGGMGVVYKARDPALKRLVALKMIRSAGASDRDRQRFRAEAEAIARLQHPGIVGIYEVGELQGLPFCALEYVEGGSLAGRLGGRPLAPRRAARVVEALARAAHAVHELNLIHRDLKPSNVLLQGRPEDPVEHCTPKIADFGLAKFLDAGADTGFTCEGTVLGTPSYMAPEQAAGQTAGLDRRTDVYALGAILYEVLTGRPPLKGASVSETIWQVQNREPVPPSKLAPAVDRDLETVCLKCLEKEPARRFATALELADELERYLNDEPIRTRRVGLAERGLKWARRRPTAAAAWALALLVAVLGSAGAFAGWQWAQAEQAREQAETSRQQADEARKQAEGANAELDRQKRLADEARGWALQDRLRFEQALEKAREPSAAVEAKLRREFEDARRQLARGAYPGRIDLAHRCWQSSQVAQARRVLDALPAEGSGWEYGYVDRLCRGANLPTPGGAAWPVSHLAFSASGTRVATTGGTGMRVWDYPAGANPQAIGTRPGSLRFSPDGTRLAAPSGKGVWLIDATTGKLQRELRDLVGNAAGAVDFSPDGKRLAVIDEGREDVPVVDVTTGERVFALPGHRGGARAVAFSPDGRRLATATDDGFRLWDPATGKELRAHAAGVAGHRYPIAFSWDGKRIACIDGVFVGVWDVAGDKRVAHVDAGQMVVRAVAFLPNGHLATGGSDTTVRTWDVRTGRGVRVFRGLPVQVEGVAADPKGRALAAWDRDGNAAMWDPSTDQDARVLPHRAAVTGLAFHPASTGVATVTQSGLRVFEPASGKEVGGYAGELGGWNRVAYGGKGRWLAGGGDNGVTVLDGTDGREAWAEKGRASGVAFSPDGERLLLAGERLTIRDPATGRVEVTCEREAGEVKAVSFSADGRQFAVGYEDRVAIHDPATGKKLRTIPVTWLQSVAFGPNGRQLAVVSGHSVRLWDAAGKEARQLTHVSLGAAVAFSPDGRRVATGGWDRVVQVWDVETGQLILTLPGHAEGVSALAFSPDGRWLASAARDGTARLWDAGPRERKH